MELKKAYKQLRKKLKNRFTSPRGNNYYVYSGVGLWVKQCGIKPKPEHTNIICTIFGSVPYPFQEADREKVLKYLKNHKYKEFKNERLP